MDDVGVTKKMPIWKGAVLVGVALALGVGSLWYYRNSTLYPSTDDAYVGANVVHVAPQISGAVKTVQVQNYQSIQAGDVLLQVDPASFNYVKDQASAELALDQAKLQALQAQVEVSKAEVQQTEADLFTASANNDRLSALAKANQVSQQEADQAKGTYLAAKAAVSAKQHALLQAENNVMVGQHQVAMSQASLDTALLNLSFTALKAPVAGQLAQFSVRPGDFVTTGQNLFELVERSPWWVDANYKETQLARIRVGQSATVVLDRYPGHEFSGSVIAVSPSSGASFSLLPAENATGNWVKVVQRYPVRVDLHLTADERANYPLGVGNSATVTVDTTA